MAGRPFFKLLLLLQVLQAFGRRATCPDAKEFDKLRYTAGISGEDTSEEMFMAKLAQGNMGAARVLVDFRETTPTIDPEAVSWIVEAMGFDVHGIVGSKIWLLFQDVCKKDIVCVHTVIRALRLNMVDECTVFHAIQNRGRGLDPQMLLSAVQARIPTFKKWA